MTDQTTPLRDRIAAAIWARTPEAEPSPNGLVMGNPHGIADAVLAVLPATADLDPDDVAARTLASLERVTARARRAEAEVQRLTADRAAVPSAAVRKTLRRWAYAAGHIEAELDGVVDRMYELIARDVRRMADETATTETQADDLPARLEAALTERYTDLGNPFAEMRRQEKGPDGWPASHPVGPHHVAETLRELLAAGARQDGAQQ